MNSDSTSGLSEESKRGQSLHSLPKKQSKNGLRKSNGRMQWQQSVYKIGKSESQLLANFHRISVFVFKRDKHICQSCFKTRYKLRQEGYFLTAHHIVPRSEVEGNDFDNLITLCNNCHDQIEGMKLRNKEEIYGYLSCDKRHWYHEKSIGQTWQQIVYGGQKKPK